MAEDATAAEHFYDGFLLPLIYGQEVTIGLPIAKDTWEELCADVSTRSPRCERVDIALQIRLAELLADPPLVSFDLQLLKIAVGMYQLLFGFHAAAEQGRVSDSRLESLAEDTARLLSTVGTPEDRTQVLARHVVLDGFFLLYRKDVQIFFRVGAKRFFGQDVEWMRLPFRWRIHYEEVQGTDIATSIYGRHTGRAFEQLQRLSPLTRLLRADRLYDAFDFRGLESVLKDPVVCRLVVNQIFVGGFGLFLPGLGVGFRRLVEQGEPSAWIRYVARFLVTLVTSQLFFKPQDQAAELLDCRYRPPSYAMKFEAPEIPEQDQEEESAEQEDESGTTYQELREKDALLAWSVVVALLQHNDVLAVPELPELHDEIDALIEALARATEQGLAKQGGHELVATAMGTRAAGH